MSFYVARGGHYEPTELTRGPWDPASQHAGPPCALLGRELDDAGGIAGARVARATFEILRPVPIAPLVVQARVVRPGRSVELVEGTMHHGEQEVMRASAWRIRTGAVEDHAPAGTRSPDGPEQAVVKPFFDTGQETGYHTAMEVRFVHGSYREPGPAQAWMRMRVPLVEGHETSPLERVLVAADSGNGVSAPLDYTRHVFINTDLSVALLRPPVGEWVCLDATSLTEPDGIGLSDTALYDEQGLIGRATQSLLVASR